MIRIVARIGCRAAAAALVAACTLASARAEPPDIMRYCRTYFPGHYSVSLPGGASLSTLDGSTVMFCINTAGTRGQQGMRGKLAQIDFAVACRLTNGSEHFRYIDGLRIDCSRQPRTYVARGPGVDVLEPEDLVKYCADTLGPGAQPEYSATLKRAVCSGVSAPGPNPFTINFALACKQIHKTDKVRYVDAGDRDHIACVA